MPNTDTYESALHVPDKIQALIAGESYQADGIGLSASSVRLYSDKILKIQEYNKEARTEYQMLCWLAGKLPVPEILAHEVQEGKSFLLMSRCHGVMACADQYMYAPRKQAELLAKGLKALWNVEISACPSDNRLSKKLEAARYKVEHGLVDLDNVEPDTFGVNGFENPAALLQWLCENQPTEELVLSHGDYCLPNVFLHGDDVTGYIDLGRTGIADKWCDIAICYRSLSYNFSGRYHGKAYSGLDDMLLFKFLDMEPDWTKIKYYILLDELF